jgi:hypothetical protein
MSITISRKSWTVRICFRRSSPSFRGPTPLMLRKLSGSTELLARRLLPGLRPEPEFEALPEALPAPQVVLRGCRNSRARPVGCWPVNGSDGTAAKLEKWPVRRVSWDSAAVAATVAVAIPVRPALVTAAVPARAWITTSTVGTTLLDASSLQTAATCVVSLGACGSAPL